MQIKSFFSSSHTTKQNNVEMRAKGEHTNITNSKHREERERERERKREREREKERERERDGKSVSMHFHIVFTVGKYRLSICRKINLLQLRKFFKGTRNKGIIC